MMKRAGLKLEVTASVTESDGPVGKAQKMQEDMFVQAVAECAEWPSFTKRHHPCWVISLTNLAALDELPHHEGNARMHRAVVPIQPSSSITLTPNDHCPPPLSRSSSSSHHEDCIEQLEELLPDSICPSCAFSFFISQNWEGGRPNPSGYYNVRGHPHPDNKLNTKVLLKFVCHLNHIGRTAEI
jgi:hypothetical protein